MDLELERFKRDVNLSELAASVGYQLRQAGAVGKREVARQLAS